MFIYVRCSSNAVFNKSLQFPIWFGLQMVKFIMFCLYRPGWNMSEIFILKTSWTIRDMCLYS